MTASSRAFSLHHPRDTEDVLPPFTSRDLGPGLEGSAGGFDRAIDVGFGTVRDLGDRLFRSRIDRLEPLAFARLDELAANKQVVRRLQADMPGAFRSRSEVPTAVGCAVRFSVFFVHVFFFVG